MTDFYDSGIEGLGDQSLSWVGDDFRVVLLAAGYPFKAEHTVFADVAAHANGTSDPLENRAVAGRQFLADGTYVIATKAARCDRVAVFRRARDAAQSRLLLCASIAPVLPVAGQRIDIDWPQRLIFSL